MQAARLFGKSAAKFHTLEHDTDEEPRVDVPKELQERPAALPDQAVHTAPLPDQVTEQSRLNQSIAQQAPDQAIPNQRLPEQGSQQQSKLSNQSQQQQQQQQQQQPSLPHPPSEAGFNGEHRQHAPQPISTAAGQDDDKQQAQVLAIQQQDRLRPPKAPEGSSAQDSPGPVEQGSWHQPFQEDPASPSSSSGSALDPQLYRCSATACLSALLWAELCRQYTLFIRIEPC